MTETSSRLENIYSCAPELHRSCTDAAKLVKIRPYVFIGLQSKSAVITHYEKQP